MSNVPSEKYAWYVVIVLSFAYLNSFVDRMVIALLVEPIKRDLALTDVHIGLLQGFAFAVFYAVMGIPLGRLADGGNRTVLITAGMTLWSIATAACGLAKNFWTLFVCRIGVGVGEASLSPAAWSMISDLFPKEKLGRAIGVYAMGGFIGSGVALMLGGYILDVMTSYGVVTVPGLGEFQPWQMTFVIVGLPGLLIALLIYTTVREPERKTGAEEASDQASFRLVLSALRHRWRFYAPLFVSAGLWALVTYGAYAWTPTFFVRKFGWDLKEVGLAYGSVSLLGGAIAPFFGGWLVDRFTQKQGAPAALYAGVLILIAACSLAVGPLMPTPGLALGVIAIGVCAKTAFSVVPATAIQIYTPNRMRGQMTAIYLFCLNMIGLTLGPLSIALITDYHFKDEFALPYSMAIVPAVCLPAAILLLNLTRRYVQQNEQSAAAFSPASRST